MLFDYALSCKDYIASVIDEWMSKEHWWNDTDRLRLFFLLETSLYDTIFGVVWMKVI